MLKWPPAQCRRCGTSISHFALACPNCHAASQPDPVATITALVMVLFIGVAIVVGTALFRPNRPQPTVPTAADAPAKPAGEADADYGWLMEAMAKCEADAKQRPDVLHFLVVPVTPTGSPLPGWSPTPIGDVGSSAKLLSATDVLFGLRNRVMALYGKPLTFLISDPKTKASYKWQPAVGVAALNTSDLGFADLRLGFEMPDVADGVEWGPTVRANKGICYWINPLVLARGRTSG
jgi:hypothetical protein